MDRTPVEVVQRVCDAFASEPITLERVRGTWGDSLLTEFYAPEAVFDMTGIPGWPESQSYEGHDGIRRFWTDWFGIWDEVDWETESVEPVGDFVVAVALQRGSGNSSHAPVEWRLAFLGTCRDSKLTVVRFFADEAEAVRVALSQATLAEARVRRFGDAVSRGDCDAAIDECHEDVRFASVLASLEGEAFAGHDGIRRYFDAAASSWDEWRVEFERITEAPDGRVAVAMTMHVRGHESGLALTQRTGHVWELREGKLWRCTPFPDGEAAMAETGLGRELRGRAPA